MQDLFEAISNNQTIKQAISQLPNMPAKPTVHHAVPSSILCPVEASPPWAFGLFNRLVALIAATYACKASPYIASEQVQTKWMWVGSSPHNRWIQKEPIHQSTSVP